jgi:hypothetical protein
VSDRFEQLEMRRRQLLIRSARLRADLAADQQIILDTIGGVDRIVGRVRGIASLASPLLLVGGGALLFALLKRFRPARAAVRGFAWLAMARRLLPLVSIIRAVMRSRSRQDPHTQP